jgi:hypothetical protein
VRVYVAGPISKGDQFLNVRNAILVADILIHHGHSPFVPHLCALWSMVTGRADYEAWMKYDDEWLCASEAVVWDRQMCPGESSGAEREVIRAKKLGIPVFDSIQEFLMEMEVVAQLNGLTHNG